MSRGDLQRAYVEFQTGLQYDPHNKDILNSLGLVHLQLEEYEKAKQYLLKAVAEDPSFSDAYNNLGVTYTKLGDLQKAIECFKKAIANPLYKTPENAYYNLGMAYYRLDQFNASIDAFQDSVKRSPMFASSYYGLALTYNKAGRFGEASKALTKAIGIDVRYRGDRAKFAEETRERVNYSVGDEKADYNSYLEILHY